MITRLKMFFRKIYNRIRFGSVRPVVKSTIDGVVVEVAYMDRDGKIVGYWACGHFDPNLPYSE